MLPVIVFVLSLPADGSVRQPDSGIAALPGWSAVREWGEDAVGYVRLYARIAAAPKLHYELQRVRSYRDGVVAEVRVTNRARFPVELDEVAASAAAGGAAMTDAAGAPWEAPWHDGCIKWVDRSRRRKLVVGPGASLSYAAHISTVAGPLRPEDGRMGAGRPTTLRYWFRGRQSAYQPGADPSRWVNVYLIGSGIVPVEWSNGDAPAWVWKACVKVDPPAGILAIADGSAGAIHWPLQPAAR